MADFNAEVVCTELKANVKSNQHRIDELSVKVDNFQEIIICIREIVAEMRGMKEAQDEIKKNQEKSQEEFRKSQEELAKQIREVEKVPDKKAAGYVDKVITALISAAVAYFIANFKK